MQKHCLTGKLNTMELRIDKLMKNQEVFDKSFLEKDHPLSIIFGTNKYTKTEMRETWFRGIRHGIEIGLSASSPEGQIIELNKNCTTPRQQEFLDEFYKLAEKYNCKIQYHPELGMTVRDLNS